MNRTKLGLPSSARPSPRPKKTTAQDHRINEDLYETLQLLKYLHPTTSTFDEVCKRDMFVKNNAAAFQETMYYLLRIYYGNEGIKKKVPSWPTFDKRIEMQFRKDVMQAINELGVAHPEAQLPKVVTSQLISPGGVKFATLMLTLATLVAQVHLKRTAASHDEIMLEWIHPQAGLESLTPMVLSHTAKLTCNKRKCTAKLQKDFDQELDAYREEADTIIGALGQGRENIARYEAQLAQLAAVSVVQNQNDLVTKVNELEQDGIDIGNIALQFRNHGEMITYLSGPGCYLNLDNAPMTMGLLQYFEMFSSKCEVSIYDVKRTDVCTINRQLQMVSQLSTDYDALLTRVATMAETIKLFQSELATYDNKLKSKHANIPTVTVTAGDSCSSLFDFDF